jgi:hypothetical protein
MCLDLTAFSGPERTERAKYATKALTAPRWHTLYKLAKHFVVGVRMVSVDVGQCQRVGEVVKGLSLKPCEDLISSFPAGVDAETRMRVLFYVTAICHQTRRLRSENIAGWDLLKKRFVEVAVSNPAFFNPKRLREMGINGVAAFLNRLFNGVGLTQVKGRAGLLVDCAETLSIEYGGNVSELLAKTGGSISDLYLRLGRFKAYNDPLRKKSGVLIRCLSNENLFRIKDLDCFVPIVDYHMMRVLLRTGCIRADDEAMVARLKKFQKIGSDTEFRVAAQTAFKIISKVSGKNLFDLNDIFWSLGRSCCFYGTTLCADGTCSKTQCTLKEMLGLKDHDRCVLDAVCAGRNDPEQRRLKEPNVNTAYY